MIPIVADPTAFVSPFSLFHHQPFTRTKPLLSLLQNYPALLYNLEYSSSLDPLTCYFTLNARVPALVRSNYSHSHRAGDQRSSVRHNDRKGYLIF